MLNVKLPIQRTAHTQPTINSKLAKKLSLKPMWSSCKFFFSLAKIQWLLYFRASFFHRVFFRFGFIVAHRKCRKIALIFFLAQRWRLNESNRAVSAVYAATTKYDFIRLAFNAHTCFQFEWQLDWHQNEISH